MIDANGFRLNVGIILSNARGQVLWARRCGQEAWQFPQGGIKYNESPRDALFRELHEELGLHPCHVRVMGCTQGWLRYRLPKNLVRHDRKPVCIGQKQIWYLLNFVGEEHHIQLDLFDSPEFDDWQWVDYWTPLHQVVAFKRGVYQRALTELAPLVLARLTNLEDG